MYVFSPTSILSARMLFAGEYAKYRSISSIQQMKLLVGPIGEY